jgi:hypothetical protein
MSGRWGRARGTRLLAPMVVALVAVAGLGALTPSVPAAEAATSGGRFTAVTTARVFSGRVGTAPVVVPVAGHGGIATDATAVVVNVETASPTASGYVRVTPAGRDAQVATQEFTAGATVSNLATVKLVNGALQVTLSAGSGTVFLDVSGYYSAATAASTYTPVTSARVFGRTVGTTPVRVPIAGAGGVPADATAVAVNTEVSAPTANGYVRVTPAGQDPSVAAQVFTRGRTISNLVVAKLSGGALQVKLSSGTATVFMDVSGYYSSSASGSTFVPLDTARSFAGTVTTSAQQIQLAGPAGVPANATAVVANAEVEKPTAAGYVRITPYGQDPSVATQVFGAGATISNLVLAKVTQASVQAKLSAGTARMYLDVAGYFTTGSGSSGLGNDVSWPQGGGPYPAGQTFAIVGVNDQLANTTNPYLAQQLAWAAGSTGTAHQPRAALYVLAANPGRDKASRWPSSNTDASGTIAPNRYGSCTGGDDVACAYMYGWTLAHDDVVNRGVTNPAAYRWWLDVETGSSWRDTMGNVAVLDGMTDFLTSKQISVGLYSTGLQWRQIAGTRTPRSALATAPSWIAIGPAGIAAAKAACSTTPLVRGPVSIVQYVVGSTATGADYDWSCS